MPVDWYGFPWMGMKIPHSSRVVSPKGQRGRLQNACFTNKSGLIVDANPTMRKIFQEVISSRESPPEPIQAARRCASSLKLLDRCNICNSIILRLCWTVSRYGSLWVCGSIGPDISSSSSSSCSSDQSMLSFPLSSSGGQRLSRKYSSRRASASDCKIWACCFLHAVGRWVRSRFERMCGRASSPAGPTSASGDFAGWADNCPSSIGQNANRRHPGSSLHHSYPEPCQPCTT